MSRGTYIHGTDPEEQKRLSVMNTLLNDGSLGALRLAGGERVLDLGCGLGQLTRAMARAAGPEGAVVGVERSKEQIAEATRQAEADGQASLLEIRQGEAGEPPLAPDEWGTFDVVHARFLLEHVPDPGDIVRVMVQAARPGGRIVLEDDDHDVLRMWPEPEGADRLWRAYISVHAGMGNDPFVGRRLVALLHAAGARPVRNDWLFFGSCAGDPHFQGFADNLLGVLRGARDAMIEAGLVKARRFEESLDELRAWARRGDAALWYGRSWAEGRRPES